MAAFQSHLVLLAFRPIVEFPESVGHLTEIVSAPSLPDARDISRRSCDSCG